MIEPIFKEKRRIAGPLLAKLPKIVAERVKERAEDYRIKSATFAIYPYGYEVYAGEGDRFDLFMGDQSVSVEMGASHTVGAAGLAWDIGTRKTPPKGAWIIRIHYYTKYWMSIIHIADEEVSDG